MSNITVVEVRDELAALPADILTTRLNGFIDAGRFTGRYDGATRGAIEESFEQNLARICARAETPRLAGVQIKAPMLWARWRTPPSHRSAIHPYPQAGRHRWLRDAANRGMALS
ncbi:hypothetical protein [Sphingobium fuliginis]|jgi:hypothetical protein|uniref:hypothetical protein n=1 Tax=Sphingobium fuliginis (strain ATCC 27551) TaxID=336203 RepID=UPI000419BB5C|nr:hypothetical protein [Sphingobium fuliginis]